jgi:peptidoglycan/LPS O-acetylase OafA/YrhL
MTEPEDATTGGPDSAPTVAPSPLTGGAPSVSPERAARPSATGSSRISALDGLRAVALLIIMGYHFGVGWLQGGFFSLDIFYVLSGYLITGLLLSEYAKRGRIKLSAFWLRRARRLLPALLIVLVAVTLMVRFAEPAGLYPGFRLNALSALFYFSNWWQIHASGNYFVMTGATSPLTHTWSLAVEEQFYLVWPLVVLAVFTLAKTVQKGITALLFVSGIGAMASALEMAALYHPRANITRLYFGTDTHAQSILVGATMACALTLIQRKRGQEGMAPTAHATPARYGLILLGLAGFAGTFTLTYLQGGTAAFDYQGGFFLSALSAAAIILGAVCVPGGPIAWTLSLKPLVWLGTISYGAYLWHYPVFIYLDRTRTGASGFPLLLIRFAVTFAFAAASYYLVERPVMYGTFWRSLKAIGPATVLLVATVAVVIAGTVVPATAAIRVTNTLPTAERQALTQARAFTTSPVRFMLLGDSIALTLGVGLGQHSQSRYGVKLINGGVLGCDFDDLPAVVSGVTDSPESVCKQWPKVWANAVTNFHPDVVGMLMGRWDITDHVDHGQVVHIGQPAWDAHLTAEVDQAVSIMSAHGAKVVLFTMPDIAPSQEAPDGSIYPENQPIRVTEFNQILSKVAARHPGVVTLIDLNKMLDPDGQFQTDVDGVTVRWADGIHISETGGEWLQPRVLPAVAQLGLSARAAVAAGV